MRILYLLLLPLTGCMHIDTLGQQAHLIGDTPAAQGRIDPNGTPLSVKRADRAEAPGTEIVLHFVGIADGRACVELKHDDQVDGSQSSKDQTIAWRLGEAQGYAKELVFAAMDSLDISETTPFPPPSPQEGTTGELTHQDLDDSEHWNDLSHQNESTFILNTTARLCAPAPALTEKSRYVTATLVTDDKKPHLYAWKIERTR